MICDFETVGYKTLRHFVRIKLVLKKKKEQEEILSVCLVYFKRGWEKYKTPSSFYFFFLQTPSQVSNLLAIYLCYCWVFIALCLSLSVCCIVRCQMALIYIITYTIWCFYSFNFGKLQECTTFCVRLCECVSVCARVHQLCVSCIHIYNILSDTLYIRWRRYTNICNFYRCAMKRIKLLSSNFIHSFNFTRNTNIALTFNLTIFIIFFPLSN